MEVRKDIIGQFLQSRRQGLSPRTLEFYAGYLRRAEEVVGLNASGEEIRSFLAGLRCSNGGKHAYYRTLRVFYLWLYSRKSGFALKPSDNPLLSVDAPKVQKRLLPALLEDQVVYLLGQAVNGRDKAIISLFCDSGLRLSELARIRTCDIDWARHLIKVECKGGREGLAVFGLRTEELLKQWLEIYSPNGRPIWGLKPRGIQAMLWRLQSKTGVKCNPHCMRRGFATTLSKRGVDALHIMRLGRWESISMVDLYTKTVQFEDSLRYYSAIVTKQAQEGQPA